MSPEHDDIGPYDWEDARYGASDLYEDPDMAWTDEHGPYRARSVRPIETVNLPEGDQ